MARSIGAWDTVSAMRRKHATRMPQPRRRASPIRAKDGRGARVGSDEIQQDGSEHREPGDRGEEVEGAQQQWTRASVDE